jgi:tellurite resistance protein TerC
MAASLLFPFADYWWFYLGFVLFVLALLLLLDLGVFHRRQHPVSFKESISWSAIWISLALLFNYGLYLYAQQRFASDSLFIIKHGLAPTAAARQVGLEFLAGFVIEKSLAIDNIFVFVVVFSFFRVPTAYQHRILFFGILGALVFRAIFIAMGAALLQFHWVVLAVGLFLIFTGTKILFTSNNKPDPGSNAIVRLVTRLVPVTPELHGQHFFVRQAGVLYATPLLLCLVFIEVSDVIFATDSVPAIFAITREPLIVFTSNIFAILGLRSLYFILAAAVDRFHYLKLVLGLILILVGSKMSWLPAVYGAEFPLLWSLAIIGVLLGTGILASIVLKPQQT